jgi:hypothetical protein
MVGIVHIYPADHVTDEAPMYSHSASPLAEVTEHGVGLLAEQRITTVTTVRSG